jgi:predicted PurR-regulated permease PerM
MNRLLLVILILFLPKIVLSQDNTITLLQELDQTIQNIEQYSNQKEAKIDSLKKQFKYSKVKSKQVVSQHLYDEYRLYKSDSALVLKKC